MAADPVESVRGEVLRRIVDSGAFTLEQIQRENSPAPNTLPYARLTIAQGAEWVPSSQNYMTKTIIAEVDIFTSEMSQTQLAGSYASTIEQAFGLYDRKSEKRNIPMPGWSGATATVTEIGRGSATTESDKGLYRLPVLVYVKITLEDGAHYEF